MGKQRIKIQYFWKVFLIIPIVLLFNVNILLTEGGIDSSVGAIMANALFEYAQIGDMKAYVFVIEGMYFIFVFNMLFGTYIYQDFQVSSIYLFSRLRDRRKWFYKKVIEIGTFSLIYTFLFLTTLFVICIFGSNQQLDVSSIHMMGMLLIFISLFLTATTLLINLLTIKYNSSIGFICVYLVLLLLITVLLQSDWIALFTKTPYLLLLNPVAGVILNLAEDRTMGVLATIYYLILNGIIICGGAKFVNRLEIGLLEKDRDG